MRKWAVFALRAEVLRHLLGLPSFRAYSRMLAGSDLLTDFCGVRTLEGIKMDVKKAPWSGLQSFLTRRGWRG